MPLRRPHEDEDQASFMRYCMRELADSDREQDQKVAICLRQWREGPEKSKSARAKMADVIEKVAKYLAEGGLKT